MSVGDHGKRTDEQEFFGGVAQKILCRCKRAGEKALNVLLYRNIVLQHMRKLTLGYTGYTEVKCIFQLNVLHFFGDNVYCCFVQILSIMVIEKYM